jgi:hypothetical protein
MQRPEPKKHAECSQCLEHAPLLMPVAIAPGFAVFTWPLLCLLCRLNVRSNDYEMLASDLLHSRHEESRAAYPEWMAAEI